MQEPRRVQGSDLSHPGAAEGTWPASDADVSQP